MLVLLDGHGRGHALHRVVAGVAHRVEAEVLRAADFRHAGVEHRLDAGGRQLADDGFGFLNRIGLAERGEEILRLARSLAHDVDLLEQQRDSVDRAEAEDHHDAHFNTVEVLKQFHHGNFVLAGGFSGRGVAALLGFREFGRGRRGGCRGRGGRRRARGRRRSGGLLRERQHRINQRHGLPFCLP